MATWYVVPARKGSVGVPLKNRKLVPHLLGQMMPAWREHCILTTDDDHIVATQGFSVGVVIRRPKELATDTASMRVVLRHAVQYMGLADSAVLVVLYPTYPSLHVYHIERAVSMVERGAPVVLGRLDIADHPYRCFLAGEPIAPAGVYRRQDHPPAWAVCHAVCVMRASALAVVDENLWCRGVEWLTIPRQLDVDTPRDMEEFER